MILYRTGDGRYPFFWEDTAQPAARWHATGEGPVQYLADTPNGAWAEFLRHEEIVSYADLAGVRRALWAVEVGEIHPELPAVGLAVTVGDVDTYEVCQDEARVMRGRGTTELNAPSAALLPGRAAGWHTDDGLHRAPARDGEVIVLFGARPGLEGWLVTAEGRPGVALLDDVRHFAT